MYAAIVCQCYMYGCVGQPVLNEYDDDEGEQQSEVR